MHPYSCVEEALKDVLRLSRGMTYKAATLGVKLGGGKAVIIGDPHTEKTPDLLQAMGQSIDRLGGQYIAGEDIGTNPDDMRILRENTKCVSCLHKKDGGLGDPAPMTAFGVFSSMRAGLEFDSGRKDFDDIHVAVQGVGNVGKNLCLQLKEAGARLTIADANPEVAKQLGQELGADVVATDEIYDVEADIFSPCAIGAILNDVTIPRLKARIVAGAANNQLAEERHGQMLRKRGIIYLPDYVANGGGLISCAAEWYGSGAEGVREEVCGIYNTCTNILKKAETYNIPTNTAADQIAETRFLNETPSNKAAQV